MGIHEIIKRSRSYRRFHQDVAVDRSTLEYLVDLARLSPSSWNKQMLKYYLACDAHLNAAIFECLTWAAYLKDWPGPAEGERPAAYIIVLGDRSIVEEAVCDHGIAAQSILLGATERGLGGCIIGTLNRTELAARLKLSQNLEILLVIALGKPKEKVVIEEIKPDGDVKYWRDESGVHHVPKRGLAEIIVNQT